MESFFKALKVERIHQVRYDNLVEARLDIVDWIEGFYNRVRMHTAIGFLAPVTRECSFLAAWLGARGNEAGSERLRQVRRLRLFAGRINSALSRYLVHWSVNSIDYRKSS